MVRLLLGLIKGALAGALVGFAVIKLGIGAGALSWLAYAATGALVGVICGKPPWKHDTFWTPLLKGLVGALVGLGLAFLGRKFLGGVPVPGALVEPLGLPGGTLASLPPALATLIGAVYGALIELDDGGSSGGSKGASARPPAGR